MWSPSPYRLKNVRPPVPALSAQGPSHLLGQLRSAPRAGSVGTPQLGGM